MPFDGQNFETDEFSLARLVGWLETQSPGESYVYVDSMNCLLARWNLAHGRTETAHGYAKNHSALHDIAMRTPWTYGAALQRARALLEKTTT